MNIPFSIVIPTHNRPQRLKKTLDSLIKQNYPKNSFEVIVCSDIPLGFQSADYATYEEYFNIRCFNTSKRGPSSSRNLGIKRAKYNHVIFIDDDCIADQNWLKEYNSAWLRFPKAKIIGGSVSLPSEILQAQRDTIMKHPWCFSYLRYPQERRLQIGDLLFSANFSYRRISIKETVFDESLGTLKRIGPFSLQLFGEDTELIWRCILSSDEVIYNPLIKVIHDISNNRFRPSYIAKRYFITGIEMAMMDRLLKKKFSDYTGRLGKNREAKKVFESFQDIYHVIRLSTYLLTFLFT